jgi:Lon protease-like protein
LPADSSKLIILAGHTAWPLPADGGEDDSQPLVVGRDGVALNSGAVGLAFWGSDEPVLPEVSRQCLSKLQPADFLCNEVLGANLFSPSAQSAADTGNGNAGAAEGEEITPEELSAREQFPGLIPFSIPLFRLPDDNVGPDGIISANSSVLFPGQFADYRIFEPRYRLMLSRALQHPKSEVTLEEQMLEPAVPGVFGIINANTEVGTLVRVGQTELAKDGSASLRLYGLRRFRVVSATVPENGFGLVEARAVYVDDDSLELYQPPQPVRSGSEGAEEENADEAAMEATAEAAAAGAGERQAEAQAQAEVEVGVTGEDEDPPDLWHEAYSHGIKVAVEQVLGICNPDTDQTKKVLDAALKNPADFSFIMARQVPASTWQKYQWIEMTSTEQRLLSIAAFMERDQNPEHAEDEEQGKVI